MTRHLHSHSLSRNLSLSSPDKKSALWSLPTPPPSLSDLSTLACPESPPPRVVAAGGDQQHMDRSGDRELLPISFTTLSHPTPWFTRIPTLGVRIPSTRLSAGSVGAWLALYLVCNLALTLHNKHLLNDFPFPWLLTALHAFCAALGSGLCAWRGVFKPAPLNHSTTPLLALFSVLYSANIAASNASLRLVSIATHQVVRAVTPLFVVLFAWIGRVGLGAPELRLRGTLAKHAGCLGVSSAKLKSLTPVVLGVVFATYGDYSYTRTGLVLTVLGTALAALKTMLASRVVRVGTGPVTLPRVRGRSSAKEQAHTQRMSLKRPMDTDESPSRTIVDEGYLSGSGSSSEGERIHPSPALHPLDVLLRLSPLACVQCLVAAYLSGELGRWSAATQLTTGDTAHLSLPTSDIDQWTITKTLDSAGTWHWRVLALNGALAFVLNYVSFVASRRAGALSMTVAANIKQVLTILLALVVFDAPTPPSAMHLLGIGLTLGGGVWYGLVEVRERRERGKEGI